MDKELIRALGEAARTGCPLSDEMASRLLDWLTETWGDRVNGDAPDYRHVSPERVAMELCYSEDLDPHSLLKMTDSDLLRIVCTSVSDIIERDVEHNLSAACLVHRRRH
jgi:hypothetical protein